MKRFFCLCCIYLIGTLLIPFSSFAFHDNNYSQTWECGLCHPGGPHAHVPECIECHNNDTGANYTDTNAPQMMTHSSAAFGPGDYGEWQQDCTDCHNPHHNNGITKNGGVEASDPSRILVEFTADYAVTVDYVTTMDITSAITANDSRWADPATWGAKTGNNERGLVLLIVIKGKTYVYEVLSATASRITFSTGFSYFPQAPKSNPIPMKLVYGMLIQDEIGPYPVIYSGPNSMADDDGSGPGGIDSTPDGICQVCHTRTLHWRNDGSLTNHYSGQNCIPCHDHRNGFAHGGAGTSCETCHGDLQAKHLSTPGSGWVVVHADTDHDDAGWNGPKPYFDVEVDCVTCHATDLPAIHGNDCSTCHPAPYDTLGTWNGGCQQGGCHTVYHEDSTMAHWPFEDPYDPENDCNRCHNVGSFEVVQENCLNCHATYGPGDTTPPTTSLKDQINEPIGPDPVVFVGTTQVRFSMQDNNGKVGIGRTFYKIDDGQTIGAMEMIVSNDNPGTHVIEYCSIDQSGNEESLKSQAYTMIQDNTAPTTTSNAKAEYWPTTSRVITFTATDGNSTMGVKNTYFRYNGGAVQKGSQFTVPLPTGTYPNNTLEFWSDDWSGNTGDINTVTFTTTGGTGTLRLVWGNSDTNPGDMPTGNDWADWTIRRGSWSGPLVASGSGAAPNWDGVDDVIVQVSPTPYFIRINWQWEDWDDQTDFANIFLTTPGQVIRLSY